MKTSLGIGMITLLALLTGGAANVAAQQVTRPQGVYQLTVPSLSANQYWPFTLTSDGALRVNAVTGPGGTSTVTIAPVADAATSTLFSAVLTSAGTPADGTELTLNDGGSIASDSVDIWMSFTSGASGATNNWAPYCLIGVSPTSGGSTFYHLTSHTVAAGYSLADIYRTIIVTQGAALTTPSTTTVRTVFKFSTAGWGKIRVSCAEFCGSGISTGLLTCGTAPTNQGTLTVIARRSRGGE